VRLSTGASTGTIAVTTPGGTAASAASFIVYYGVKTLSISPTSTAPGGSIKRTVTLYSPAPTGGAIVSIAGTGFPFASVTIPQGKITGTFPITIVRTAAGGTYIIAATYSDLSATATLTVTAPPASRSATRGTFLAAAASYPCSPECAPCNRRGRP